MDQSNQRIANDRLLNAIERYDGSFIDGSAEVYTIFLNDGFG